MDLGTLLRLHCLAYPLWLVGFVPLLGVQGFAYFGRFRGGFACLAVTGEGCMTPPAPSHQRDSFSAGGWRVVLDSLCDVCHVAGGAGVEPATRGLTVRCTAIVLPTKWVISLRLWMLPFHFVSPVRCRHWPFGNVGCVTGLKGFSTLTVAS